MSTHNICFCGEMRKKYLSGTPSYLELWFKLHSNIYNVYDKPITLSAIQVQIFLANKS